MDEAVRSHFRALGEKVKATAIPSDPKHTAAWCLGQLPALYALYRQTNDSRYGEEITRLLRGVLGALAAGEPPCPKARRLAASLPGCLQALHEQWGLPGLGLKAAAAPPPRPRKGR